MAILHGHRPTPELKADDLVRGGWTREHANVLTSLVPRCWAQDPKERPTMEAVKAELRTLLCPQDASRHALVIGNNYEGERSKLPTCLNDARAMAQRLRDLHFTVTLVEEANLDDLKKAVYRFAESLPQGAFTVFYFSGHGQEQDHHNYIIPVKKDSSLPLRLTAYSTNDLIKELGSNSKTTLIILDACRYNANNDAFKGTKDGATGPVVLKDVNALASKVPDGNPRNLTQQYVYIHAADPGCVAYPGHVNGYSPFTACLLDALESGKELLDIYKSVANKLVGIAKQRPWISLGGLTEDIIF